MNRLDSIATLLVIATVTVFAGCNQDTVVGDITDPITCTGATHGEVVGSVLGVEMAPVTEVFYDASDGVGILTLTHNDSTVGSTGLFSIMFACGPAERRSYSIISSRDQGLTQYCAEQQAVATSDFYSGTQTYAGATDGVVVVDEVDGCVTGRFDVEFAAPNGIDSLSGWFRVITP